MKMGIEMEKLRGAAKILSSYGYGLAIVAWMLADFVPRFFQGDSIAYLMTGEGWIPPDRSWAFGFASNFMLRHTHGYNAFMLMQVGVLACLIAASRVFFSDFGRSRIIYGVIGVVLALDPLLEIYTRFLMSDFLAVAAFFAALFALFLLVRDDGRTMRLWLFASLVIASTIAAVFLRVAYALIIELAVLLVAMMMSDRLARRQWVALAITALGPFMAVGSLAMANRIVFADQFQHEPFVNKSSGIFLACVFAPALEKSDFEKVGIPITTSEFLRLDLTNYDKRSAQVWGPSPDNLHQFIKDKLGVKNDYTTLVDQTASGLVWSALRRSPIALAKVYVWSAFQYMEPSEWHSKVYEEMGLSKALPADFVAFSNRYSVLKIEPEITKIRSPLMRLYEALSYFYPLQLLLGLAAAAYLMLRERNRPSAVVLTAGLLADLASAPLYSNYVIARYILGAIIICYLLIGLAIQIIMTRRGIFQVDIGSIIDE
jgi:hypothetical protein